MPQLRETLTLPAVKAEAKRSELAQIAERIRGRDRALQIAACCWLETGLDLLKAKDALQHGEFEKWCKNELGYSKSKAEKLMQVARRFGPPHESGNLTDFPPLSVAYALAAPSTPQAIVDEFLPRVLMGEKIGPELKRTLKAHRAQSKADDRNEPVGAAPADQVLSEQCRSAVDLLIEHLGDKLRSLIGDVADVGARHIFSPAVECELRQRLAARGSP